ncbi:hypothetical protein ACWDGI_30205 [Streptomyces sp. NPDC001220]
MPKFDPLTGTQRFYDAENEFCRAEPGKRDIRLMLKPVTFGALLQGHGRHRFDKSVVGASVAQEDRRRRGECAGYGRAYAV